MLSRLSDHPEPAVSVCHAPEPPLGGGGVNHPREPGAGGPGTPADPIAPNGPGLPETNGHGEGLPVEGRGPRVSLERFEGPLDLLLHLIREDELDIGDIPIARITDQYLQTIQDLADVDLDLAGEYLVMATTLMRIKAKMLLPRDEEDDDEELDPRTELVRRLLEYREFKRVAEALGERQGEWRDIFRRATGPLPELEREDADDLGIGLVDLFRAFRDVLARVESEQPFEVEAEEYSVEDQMDWIRAECARSDDGVPFHRLFEGRVGRSLVITTFLALLEMMRLREIETSQVDRFGEIWLRRAREVEIDYES